MLTKEIISSLVLFCKCVSAWYNQMHNTSNNNDNNDDNNNNNSNNDTNNNSSSRNNNHMHNHNRNVIYVFSMVSVLNIQFMYSS